MNVLDYLDRTSMASFKETPQSKPVAKGNDGSDSTTNTAASFAAAAAALSEGTETETETETVSRRGRSKSRERSKKKKKKTTVAVSSAATKAASAAAVTTTSTTTNTAAASNAATTTNTAATNTTANNAAATTAPSAPQEPKIKQRPKSFRLPNRTRSNRSTTKLDVKKPKSFQIRSRSTEKTKDSKSGKSNSRSSSVDASKRQGKKKSAISQSFRTLFRKKSDTPTAVVAAATTAATTEVAALPINVEDSNREDDNASNSHHSSNIKKKKKKKSAFRRSLSPSKLRKKLSRRSLSPSKLRKSKEEDANNSFGKRIKRAVEQSMSLLKSKGSDDYADLPDKQSTNEEAVQPKASPNVDEDDHLKESKKSVRFVPADAATTVPATVPATVPDNIEVDDEKSAPAATPTETVPEDTPTAETVPPKSPNEEKIGTKKTSSKKKKKKKSKKSSSSRKLATEHQSSRSSSKLDPTDDTSRPRSSSKLDPTDDTSRPRSSSSKLSSSPSKSKRKSSKKKRDEKKSSKKSSKKNSSSSSKRSKSRSSKKERKKKNKKDDTITSTSHENIAVTPSTSLETQLEPVEPSTDNDNEEIVPVVRRTSAHSQTGSDYEIDLKGDDAASNESKKSMLKKKKRSSKETTAMMMAAPMASSSEETSDDDSEVINPDPDGIRAAALMRRLARERAREEEDRETLAKDMKGDVPTLFTDIDDLADDDKDEEKPVEEEDLVVSDKKETPVHSEAPLEQQPAGEDTIDIKLNTQVPILFDKVSLPAAVGGAAKANPRPTEKAEDDAMDSSEVMSESSYSITLHKAHSEVPANPHEADISDLDDDDSSFGLDDDEEDDADDDEIASASSSEDEAAPFDKIDAANTAWDETDPWENSDIEDDDIDSSSSSSRSSSSGSSTSLSDGGSTTSTDEEEEEDEMRNSKKLGSRSTQEVVQVHITSSNETDGFDEFDVDQSLNDDDDDDTASDYEIASRDEDFIDFLEDEESLHDLGNQSDEKRDDAPERYIESERCASSLDPPEIITPKGKLYNQEDQHDDEIEESSNNEMQNSGLELGLLPDDYVSDGSSSNHSDIDDTERRDTKWTKLLASPTGSSNIVVPLDDEDDSLTGGSGDEDDMNYKQHGHDGNFPLTEIVTSHDESEWLETDATTDHAVRVTPGGGLDDYDEHDITEHDSDRFLSQQGQPYGVVNEASALQHGQQNVHSGSNVLEETNAEHFTDDDEEEELEEEEYLNDEEEYTSKEDPPEQIMELSGHSMSVANDDQGSSYEISSTITPEIREQIQYQPVVPKSPSTSDSHSLSLSTDYDFTEHSATFRSLFRSERSRGSMYLSPDTDNGSSRRAAFSDRMSIDLQGSELPGYEGQGGGFGLPFVTPPMSAIAETPVEIPVEENQPDDAQNDDVVRKHVNEKIAVNTTREDPPEVRPEESESDAEESYCEPLQPIIEIPHPDGKPLQQPMPSRLAKFESNKGNAKVLSILNQQIENANAEHKMWRQESQLMHDIESEQKEQERLSDLEIRIAKGLFERPDPDGQNDKPENNLDSDASEVTDDGDDNGSTSDLNSLEEEIKFTEAMGQYLERISKNPIGIVKSPSMSDLSGKKKFRSNFGNHSDTEVDDKSDCKGSVMSPKSLPQTLRASDMDDEELTEVIKSYLSLQCNDLVDADSDADESTSKKRSSTSRRRDKESDQKSKKRSSSSRRSRTGRDVDETADTGEKKRSSSKSRSKSLTRGSGEKDDDQKGGKPKSSRSIKRSNSARSSRKSRRKLKSTDKVDGVDADEEGRRSSLERRHSFSGHPSRQMNVSDELKNDDDKLEHKSSDPRSKKDHKKDDTSKPKQEKLRPSSRGRRSGSKSPAPKKDHKDDTSKSKQEKSRSSSRGRRSGSKSPAPKKDHKKEDTSKSKQEKSRSSSRGRRSGSKSPAPKKDKKRRSSLQRSKEDGTCKPLSTKDLRKLLKLNDPVDKPQAIDWQVHKPASFRMSSRPDLPLNFVSALPDPK